MGKRRLDVVGADGGPMAVPLHTSGEGPRRRAREMRCHYDVLGVARDPAPDDDVIRRAYRRAALRCHPDKVAALQDEAAKEKAEEEFKEVQAAYECLSDPHERAFYDSHRESILSPKTAGRAGSRDGAAGPHGDEGWVGEDPDNVNLWPYFSTGCYKGFGDGPREFYGVYGSVFDEIDACERRARPGDHVPAPRFGGSGQKWDPSVSAFYAHWGAYSSGKAFGWAEPWNLARAGDRRERRAMEAENAKARRRAKREWDEQVRQLVAFVKKRDLRAVAYANSVRAAREAREEAAKVAKAERKKEAKRAAQAYAETDETKREAEEASAAMLWVHDAFGGTQRKEGRTGGVGGDGEGEGEGEDEDEDEFVEVFVCYACNKEFKSERAMQNHEKSRKHQDEVRRLRQELLRQERDAKRAAAAQDKERGARGGGEEEEEGDDDGSTEYEDAMSSPQGSDDGDDGEELEVEVEVNGPVPGEAQDPGEEAGDEKRGAGVIREAEGPGKSESESESESEEGDDLEAMLAQLNFRGTGLGGGRRRRGAGGAEDEGDEYSASPSAQRAKSKKSERRRLAREQQQGQQGRQQGHEVSSAVDAEGAGEGAGGGEDEGAGGGAGGGSSRGAPMGKAKAKKAKRAAAAAKGGVSGQDGNACASCGEGFPSRSKLMQHLKANPAHATFKR